MMLALWLLAAVSGLELLLWVPLIWKARKLIVCLLAPLTAAISVAVFMLQPTVATALILFFSIYRIFNLFRILQNRMQATYLYVVTFRTSIVLMGLQLLVGAILVVSEYYKVTGLGFYHAYVVACLLMAVVFLASLIKHLRTTLLPLKEKTYTDQELPTLTVAIPARNETEDLEACLDTLVASNYPKLEILVLDDCSQNKHTPEIIRGYAHDGVRFIAGTIVEDNWLAKNHAYQQLFDAASGDYILFCGVDVRFAPNALRSLVEAALNGQKSMLSVIPLNRMPDDVHSWKTYMLQPMRYAWELVLPRKLFRRPPPVLSTSWLASKKMLTSAGGFAAVSRSITPESYFARVSSVQNGYSFVQALQDARVISAKSFDEQKATAVRTRYPQLHRRPEQVALLTLIELGALIGPFIVFVLSMISNDTSLTIFTAFVTCAVLLACFYIITMLTYRKQLPASIIAFPVVVLADVALLNYSMYKYEFSEVIWKGRNVCVPVMRTISGLPHVG